MKNPYYILWSEAITSSSYYKKKDPDWKYKIFVLMMLLNSMNYFTILFWFKHFNLDLEKYLFIIRDGIFLPSALEGLINLGLPFVIINYFAIFYKKRYIKLIAKYPSRYNGKLFLVYSVGSLLFVVVTVIITH